MTNTAMRACICSIYVENNPIILNYIASLIRKKAGIDKVEMTNDHMVIIGWGCTKNKNVSVTKSIILDVCYPVFKELVEIEEMLDGKVTFRVGLFNTDKIFSCRDYLDNIAFSKLLATSSESGCMNVCMETYNIIKEDKLIQCLYQTTGENDLHFHNENVSHYVSMRRKC
uniref:Uncharacterized protein n=1 Tax=Pyramimonas orientalis virus TaxID=455367 RepID=A0A7M3UP47_POV01|nr:hypothetical protein HWQ62_00373 [Pyramimonas orientalis virus]